MPAVSAGRAAPASGQARAMFLGAVPDAHKASTWDDGVVQERWRGRAVAGVAVAAWLLATAGYVYTVMTHARLGGGRDDLATDPSEAVVYGAALFSAATVGVVVAVRQRRHPVGWLFLALALALSVGAAGDAYALEHGVLRGDAGAVAGLSLVAGQASFIAWFALRRGRAAPDTDGPTAVTSLGIRPGRYRRRRVGRPGGQGGPGHGLRPAVRRHAESMGGAVDRRAGGRRRRCGHRRHDARSCRGRGRARRAVPALGGARAPAAALDGADRRAAASARRRLAGRFRERPAGSADGRDRWVRRPHPDRGRAVGAAVPPLRRRPRPEPGDDLRAVQPGAGRLVRRGRGARRPDARRPRRRLGRAGRGRDRRHRRRRGAGASATPERDRQAFRPSSLRRPPARARARPRVGADPQLGSDLVRGASRPHVERRLLDASPEPVGERCRPPGHDRGR